MGNSTLKIVLSLGAAAGAGFCVFLLLEMALRAAQPGSAGAADFRFQLSSMLAMAVFGGIAVLLYGRLSRNRKCPAVQTRGR